MCIPKVVNVVQKHEKKTGENGANTEVNFLACINRAGLVLIGHGEVGQRVHDVWVCDRREFGAVHLGVRQHVRHRVLHHLKADVLSLAVTVQPEHQSAAPTGLSLQHPRHAVLIVSCVPSRM